MRVWTAQERATAIKRFWGKVQKTDLCWHWRGGASSSGYGQFWWRPHKVVPHRLAYELLVGPIPDGLTLDHLCRNRLCVNPDHLEPVTHAENIRRGFAPPALNARKTHCGRGHAFVAENTYVNPDGERECRACGRIRRRAHLERRLARVPPAPCDCGCGGAPTNLGSCYLPGHNPGVRAGVDTDQARALYLAGYSCRQIGDELGCSHTTVRRRLVGAGVEMRSPVAHPEGVAA